MANVILEKVSLNFTDLTGAKTGCTTLGSNKFWTGWAERNPDGTCNFECRWGSTGTPGNDKGSVRNTSEDAALSQLHKKVREKEAKGYTRLDTRSIQEEVTKAAAKGVDLTNGSTPKVATPIVTPASKFHPEVERLLGVIYNETSRVVRSGLSAQAGATEENPIGNLSDRQLDLGGEILEEVQVFLDQHFGKETASNKGQTFPLLRTGVPDSRVIDLTNRFMSNVPREISRESRGLQNLHRIVLSSYERLEEQRTFLQLLRDAHLAQATFQAAAHVQQGTSKAAVWYDGLNCMIECCEPGSAEFRKVKEIFDTNQSQRNANWFRGGRSILRVARVFTLTRTGTEPVFNKYAETVTRKPGAVGKIFAWHGTRTENLLGLAQKGLLMPENLPRGVHRSGAAFGKGIYHAPAWNATGHRMVGNLPTDGTNGALKSMNYTSAQGAYYGSGNTSRGAFMYLQEVALGLAEGRTSACWDQHRPAGFPKNDFIFACGTRNQGGFVHDELITFHEDAQIFRYLLEIVVD